MNDLLFNKQDLTTMASSIREMLEIKAMNSYIKRLTNPMITIEVPNIATLLGNVKIPSVNPYDSIKMLVLQKIVYLNLPNQ
jgi:hypothetical protein